MKSPMTERGARDLRDRLRNIDRKTTPAIVQLLVFNQVSKNYFTPVQLGRALRVNQKCGRESHW